MKEEKIRFCAFRNKEVINMCNCKRLGCVTDLLIDVCSGCIEAIILLVEIQEDKCLKGCKG